MVDESPTLPWTRARITAVLQAAGDVVHIEDAAETLGMSRIQASKLLSSWAQQGWLRRVGRGAYVPAELILQDTAQVLDDPWILVPALFAPAYIGGRTAAEHWDLTEQIFRDIVVLTARPMRKKSLQRQGGHFALKHIAENAIFGTKTVWRGQTRVPVSDVHKTLVDMLDDPALGGGVQHVSDCFRAYLQRADRSDDKVMAYAERLGNGAVFKRLGFLAERQDNTQALIAASRDRLTQGHAKLDPALNCPRLVTRWRLRVPETWQDDGDA